MIRIQSIFYNEIEKGYQNEQFLPIGMKRGEKGTFQFGYIEENDWYSVDGTTSVRATPIDTYSKKGTFFDIREPARWPEYAEIYALVQEFDGEIIAVTPIFAKNEILHPLFETTYWYK